MLGPLNCGASVILFLPVICIVNLEPFMRVQRPCGEKNIEKKACYICGSKDCLRSSFADIKHKHAGMVEDLKTESLKARQYIVHGNIRVKSGAVDIMVDVKQSMNSVQSSHCTGLSLTSDRMCDRCRDILREPATRIAFRRLCLQDNGVSRNKFKSNNVQEIKLHRREGNLL